MEEIEINKEEWKHMGPEIYLKMKYKHCTNITSTYQFVMESESRGHVVSDTLVQRSVP